MFVKKYPTYVHQGTWEKYKRFNCEKGFFGVIAFKNITVRDDLPMTYISESWMIDYKNISVDNGKIVHADYLAVSINNIMLDIILQQYTCDSWRAIDNLEEIPFLICTDFKYLKKSYIEGLLYYAKEKTHWKQEKKHLEEYSDEWNNAEYMLSKAKAQLNSSYGTHGCRPIRPVIGIKDYMYTRESTEAEIEEKLHNYYKANKPYDLVVACYITTYTHKTIFDMAERITNAGGTLIYVDTDSVKFQIENETKALEVIAAQNEEMKKEIVTDIQKEFLEVDNFYSFDYEGMAQYFKCLGSKKYMYFKDNHFNITIAGVPKASSNIVNQRYKNGYYNGYTIEEIIDNTLTDGRVFTPRESLYNFWDVNMSCKLGCKYIKDGIYKNDEIIIDANGDAVPVEDYFGCLLYDNEYRLSDSIRSEDCWSFVGVINKSMEEDNNIYGTN